MGNRFYIKNPMLLTRIEERLLELLDGRQFYLTLRLDKIQEILKIEPYVPKNNYWKTEFPTLIFELFPVSERLTTFYKISTVAILLGWKPNKEYFTDPLIFSVEAVRWIKKYIDNEKIIKGNNLLFIYRQLLSIWKLNK